MIYDFASKFLKNKTSVLDVGCGYGVVGLLLARDFDIDLDMIDFQDVNASIAKINAKNNGIKANVICENFLEFKSEKKYDFIVSNPPFYNSKSAKSLTPHKAKSRYEKYLPLNDLLKKSNSLLKPNGELLICYDPMFLANILSEFESLKLILKSIKFIHSKSDKEAGLVLLRAKKSASMGAKVLPPIFIHEGKNYTKEAEAIYLRANLTSQDISQDELLNLIKNEPAKQISAKGFDYSFNPSACDECGGKCCTGESGYIWIDESEISNIAKHLEIDKSELIDKFCQKYKSKVSLKEKPHKDGFACIFFDTDKNCCGIYPARPEQCRSFPFWDYFKTRKTELKKECIGVIFEDKEIK